MKNKYNYLIPVIFLSSCLLFSGNVKAANLFNFFTGGSSQKYSGGGPELAEKLWNSSANLVAVEIPEKMAEYYDSLSGTDLVEAYLSVQSGIALGPNCTSQGFDIEGNFLAASDKFGKIWLINCDTGQFTIDESRILTAVKNDLAAYISSPPGAVVTLKELSSGLVFQEYDLSQSGGFEAGSTIKTADLLPDGSICAVLRDIKLDKDLGEACILLVRSSGSEDELYELGMIRFGQEPDVLLPCGEDHIIAYSRMTARNNLPYMIDRKTGEVSLLYLSDSSQIEAIPLETCLDENGSIIMPENTQFYLFLDRMSDGKTLLAYNSQSGQLFLYRPESGDTHILTPYDSITIPVLYSGDHSERLFTDVNSCWQLKVR